MNEFNFGSQPLNLSCFSILKSTSGEEFSEQSLQLQCPEQFTDKNQTEGSQWLIYPVLNPVSEIINLIEITCSFFLSRPECSFTHQSIPSWAAQTNFESNGLHLFGSPRYHSSIQCLLAPAYEPPACQPPFITYSPHPAGSGPAREPPWAIVALLFNQHRWVTSCREQSEPFLMRTN